MRCTNQILMHGDPDRIFQLAADIQDWPRILPHYRYVIVEDQSDRHKIARMGATRDGFPVKWRARQELFREERRIRFQHIGGITRGMDVEWRIVPAADSVHVTIYHELRYPFPLLGPLFAELVVGRLFVQNIAGKTLRCIKAIVESGRAGGSS